MATVTEAVTEKVRRLSADVSDYAIDGPLTEDEKEALREAERLADLFEDVSPERYSISGNYLFQPPADISN